jgi:hypothetical protein
MRLIVALNGTSENPWHRIGLTQNPFPQIAKYEVAEACVRLQSLGGDPIPNVKYIRDKLKGFSEEFIDLCCKNYRPGEFVKFDVEFPGEWLK